MAINFVGTTSQPANVSTPEGPAYVDSQGRYFRVAGQIPQMSTIPPVTPPDYNILTPTPAPTTTDIQKMIQDLLKGSTSTQNPPAPISSVAPFNVTNYPTPSYSEYLNMVMTSDYGKSLNTYYNNLISQAGGDLAIAKGLAEQDYQRGVRISTEDTSRYVKQEQEDLASTLQSLTGITFPKERESLQDTLAKRGVAVGQDPTTGKTGYGFGGGRASYEIGQLSEDQKLRQEAVQRSSARKIEELGIGKQRSLEELGMKKQRDIGTTPGLESKTVGSPEWLAQAGKDYTQLGSTYRDYIKGLQATQKQQESDIAGAVQQKASEALQKQSLDIAKASAKAAGAAI